MNFVIRRFHWERHGRARMGLVDRSIPKSWRSSSYFFSTCLSRKRFYDMFVASLESIGRRNDGFSDKELQEKKSIFRTSKPRGVVYIINRCYEAVRRIEQR